MGAEPLSHMPSSGKGEVLKLGPPASGEIIITVDPRQTGSPFAMGTETLLPGAAIPVHRHLAQDEVLFVHKGQGRALMEGKAITVVPGTMLYVPRQAWHGLRNTGTGTLQITWTSAPPGVEAFFRELSQLHGPADAAALQAIAQRHGVEFHPDGETATGGGAPGRRRRHRGGRGRGRRPQGQASRPPHTPTARPAPSLSPAAAPQAVAAPAQGQPPSRHHRRRRHHRRGEMRAATTTAAPQIRPPTPGTAPVSQRPGPARRQAPHGRHRRRVKEVYIDGRWVQVTGEGPVIATGEERSGPRRKAREDDDTATGPLSVSL